jgi:hypothetical protein
MGDTGAMRCQQLLLDAAHRQHETLQRQLTRHGEPGRRRHAAQQRQQRHAHGHTGGGAVLGHGARRQMQVHVLRRERGGHRVRHVEQRCMLPYLGDSEGDA